MTSSRYLEQILFKEQSPAANQLFEERSDTLFESGDGDSFIDVHVQPQRSSDWKDRINNQGSWQDRCEAPDTEFVPKHSPEADSSEPPSPIDNCNFLSQKPPRYIEAQGLQSKRVSDPQQLNMIASVSTIRKNSMSGDCA